jgi:hypothetical protein
LIDLWHRNENLVKNTMTSQQSQPFLRTRDIWAAVALAWLSSAAFSTNNQNDDRSLAASIRLAFYIPRSPPHDNINHDVNLLPSAFDVDGDGTPEALALWTESPFSSSSRSNWTLQVLDVRPASTTSSAASSIYSFLPFRPKILLESTTSIMGATLSTASISERSDGRPATEISFFPLAQCTGHVTFVAHKNDTSQGISIKKEDAPIDKKLFYYCGTDWHDASQKCTTPCPSGQSQQCPAGERCFADTSCAASSTHQIPETNAHDAPSSNGSTSWHKTQAGGWPSVFTVWSQGRITMHSLTAELDRTTMDKNAKRTTKTPLQMLPQWDVSILPNSTNATTLLLELEEVAVKYVDAMSTETATQGRSTNAGLLLVSGMVTVYVPPDQVEDDDRTPEDGFSSSFVLALDVATGAQLWRTILSTHVEALLFPPSSLNATAEAQLLPVLPSRGATSVSRRRSGVLTDERPHHLLQLSHYPGMSQVNCLQEYRRSLFTTGALPFQYWGRPEDAQVFALHFDHQAGGTEHPAARRHRAGGSTQRGTQHRKMTSATAHQRRRIVANRKMPSRSRTSWLSSMKAPYRRQRFLEYGRPNVAVMHNYNGIHVFSLRNGRPICHLSLSNHMLYADLNHDGIMDSIQTITASSHGQALLQGVDDDESIAELQWVEGLAKRISDTSVVGGSSSNERLPPDFVPSQLCHLLALSGIPSREELFSVNLCASHADQYVGGTADDNRSTTMDAPGREQHLAAVAAHHGEIHGAPLLLVESDGGDGIPNGNDVVAALNTGAVNRIGGKYGQVIWHANEKSYHTLPYTAVYPTWDKPSMVTLTRLDSFNVIAPSRPILLAGQNSVAIFAPKSGKLLAAAAFPQLSISRPIVLDLNGDGTSDLIYASSDAVWGYVVVVRTGASVLFQVVVGLLMMAIMLAFLRNRFGPDPGKRSTDL